MIPLGAGFHPDVPEAVYHRDPAVEPSLSSSVARILLGRSALHARMAHPRLNPNWQDAEKAPGRALEIGAVAHKMMLGTGREVDIVEADDYKKKAAQEARAAAYAAGNIPILKSDLAVAQAIVTAGREQLAETELAGIFDDGDAELTMIWQEKPTWCRSRIDFLPRIVRQGGHVIVPDYKTTAGSAHPDDFARTLFEQGYDVQAAFYERGLRALIPAIRTVTFVFVVQEQEPPHALSIVGLDGQALELAAKKADLAIRMWSTCLATGRWPGYSPEISRVELPNWRAERTELNNMVLSDRLARWQSPPHNKEQSNVEGRDFRV